jgi:hypothetical protein
MALPFPLVPVLIGAAVGAAITYVLTKRGVRKQIADSLEDLGDSVAAEAQEWTSAAKDKVEGATKTVKKTASKIGKG